MHDRITVPADDGRRRNAQSADDLPSLIRLVQFEQVAQLRELGVRLVLENRITQLFRLLQTFVSARLAALLATCVAHEQLLRVDAALRQFLPLPLTIVLRCDTGRHGGRRLVGLASLLHSAVLAEAAATVDCRGGELLHYCILDHATPCLSQVGGARGRRRFLALGHRRPMSLGRCGR